MDQLKRKQNSYAVSNVNDVQMLRVSKCCKCMYTWRVMRKQTKKSVNVNVLLGKIIPDNVFLFNTQGLIFLSFAKESFVKLDFSILYRTSL